VETWDFCRKLLRANDLRIAVEPRVHVSTCIHGYIYAIILNIIPFHRFYLGVSQSGVLYRDKESLDTSRGKG